MPRFSGGHFILDVLRNINMRRRILLYASIIFSIPVFSVTERDINSFFFLKLIIFRAVIHRVIQKRLPKLLIGGSGHQNKQFCNRNHGRNPFFFIQKYRVSHSRALRGSGYTRLESDRLQPESEILKTELNPT